MNSRTKMISNISRTFRRFFKIKRRTIRRFFKKKLAFLTPELSNRILYKIERAHPISRARSGLAAVTIVKDESPYFQEWIEFHRLMGFDHFFVYDNGSSDNTSEILQPFQEKGLVTIIPWRNFSGTLHPQKAANAHAIANYCAPFRWAAFFDVDEFLFSPTHDSLLEALALHDDHSRIRIPWFNFGPNGHKEKPAGLVIENYTERAAFPPTIEQYSLLRYKTILDPTRVKFGGIHGFSLYKHGELSVNEEKLFLPTQAIDDVKILEHFQLNHYFTRSLAEFRNKQCKGRVSKKGKVMTKVIDSRFRQIELATCKDTNIQKHVPALKAKLRSISRPKIFGVGHGGTGTRSLVAAAKKLGFKLMHDHAGLNYPGLEEHDGGVDNAFAANYTELDLRFPDSKFIYTHRKIEPWLKTHKRKIPNKKTAKIGSKLHKTRVKMYNYDISLGYHEDLLVQAYNRHREEVLEYFKDRPDDFIEINITEGQGWEILCPFLNVPIPDASFPHKGIKSLK